MRDLTQERPQLAVVQRQRLLPQVAHLGHLAEDPHHRRQGHDQPPREAFYRQLRPAGHAPHRGRHLAPGQQVAAEMEDLEGRQAVRLVQQPGHGLGQIRQIGPGMGQPPVRRLGHRRHRPARLDHRLAKPVVAGVRPEEVAGPDDQHRRAGLRSRLQPPLHLDPDPALAGGRVLRRGLVDQRKGVEAEIVDRARQQDARALGPGGGDGVVQHRQHQLAPVAIARRVGRMDDQARALGRAGHIGGDHGVAFDPLDAWPGGLGAAGQRPNGPAVAHQRRGDFAADAAGRADHQGGARVVRRGHVGVSRVR